MTTTLPAHIIDLVELQARLFRESPVENKWPMRNQHKALLWLATDSEAEFDEAMRKYGDLTGV